MFGEVLRALSAGKKKTQWQLLQLQDRRVPYARHQGSGLDFCGSRRRIRSLGAVAAQCVAAQIVTSFL
jgi:hypothetical protein